MDQFYQLLKKYNTEFANTQLNVPEWFLQYTENTPPLYWQIIYEILKKEDRNQSIIEVGAGFGDVTALLYEMGFTNILCFEREKPFIKYIENKIATLFNKKVRVLNETYPFELDFTPDIIIQVNCIYSEGIKTKNDYFAQVKNVYSKNGTPKMFILEVIEDSYTESNNTFPEFIRINTRDISDLFPKCHIESYSTYRYPQNKVSKTLYKICK